MQFYYIQSALYLLIHLCVSKNLSGKFFAKLFFKKATASPASHASPASARPHADLIKVAYDVREDNGGIGAGKVIKRGDVTADGIHNTD